MLFYSCLEVGVTSNLHYWYNYEFSEMSLNLGGGRGINIRFYIKKKQRKGNPTFILDIFSFNLGFNNLF